MSETKTSYQKLDACEDYGNSHITGHPVWKMFTVRTRGNGKCPDGCDPSRGSLHLERSRVYLVDERHVPYNERTQVIKCSSCAILFT